MPERDRVAPGAAEWLAHAPVASVDGMEVDGSVAVDQALDRPIFVIGSPRSGTTLLRLMLDSHSRVSCGEETHFLREMETMVGRHWPLLAAYGFERDWWLARIRGFYTDFATAVLARSGKVRWAEKDPTYTLHLEFLDALFPTAQYVHLVRDGHDVVASFRDRWGYRSAARAARGEWRRYVLAARSLRDRVPGERYLELRYEDLVADTEATLRQLFEYLDEPFEEAVLEPDPAQHGGTERYRRFTAARRAAGGDETTVYRSRIGAGRTSLDPVLRLLLERGSGDLLRDLGYLDRGAGTGR